MLQAHDHVVGELHVLGYAVQNVLDQQKQQDRSLRRIQQDTALRRIQQDTALVCQDGDPVDGQVFAGRNSVRKKVLDPDHMHQQLQHDVERTTVLDQKPGRIAIGEPPVDPGSRISIEHQDSNQVQLSGSIERISWHRNTEKMLHPATKPSFRRFHTSRLSQNYIEPSDPNLPSGQPQDSMKSVQLTTGHCRSDCCCCCHRRNHFRSPSLLRNVLGSLSIGFHTSPWAAPACNSPSCRDRYRRFAYAYAFPQWLWNRILLAHLAYSQSRGPELCFRVLRVRPNNSDIMRLLRRNPQPDEIIMTEVRRLFDNGEASVLDVDENGTCVLRVRVQ